MIDGKNFFNQPVKNNLITYDDIRKTASGQGDDYTTGCLLDYPYFKNHYKMMPMHLNKQKAIGADLKAIRVNFTANIDRDGNTTMFYIIKEAKETISDFSQGIVKVLRT